MIIITQAEKDAILAEVPNAHIRRTVKQKSKRHRYYAEERGCVLRVLERIRSEEGNGHERH